MTSENKKLNETNLLFILSKMKDLDLKGEGTPDTITLVDLRSRATILASFIPTGTPEPNMSKVYYSINSITENPLTVEEFKHTFAKEFADKISYKDAPLAILEMANAICNVEKVHKGLQGMIPEWDEKVFEKFEDVSNSRAIKDIKIMNCVCSSALAYKSKEAFKERLPQFIEKSELISMSTDFNKVPKLIEMLTIPQKISPKHENLLETLGVVMGNQIAFLKWREQHPHIQQVCKIYGDGSFSNYTLEIQLKNTIQIEKLAYEKKLTVPYVKDLVSLLETHANEQDHLMSLRVNGTLYSKDFIYTSKQSFTENPIGTKIKTDGVVELFNENKEIIENIKKYADHPLLQPLVQTFKKTTNNNEIVELSKIFVDTLDVIAKEEKLSKAMDKSLASKKIEDTTDYPNWKM